MIPGDGMPCSNVTAYFLSAVQCIKYSLKKWTKIVVLEGIFYNKHLIRRPKTDIWGHIVIYNNMCTRRNFESHYVTVMSGGSMVWSFRDGAKVKLDVTTSYYHIVYWEWFYSRYSLPRYRDTAIRIE